MARCSKLVVDGEVVQDSQAILEIWADHFRGLTKSRLGETAKGVDLQEKIKVLVNHSHENEEFLLDVLFAAEEVSRAVRKLRKRKHLVLMV